MPNKTYFLKPGNQEPLFVEWGFGWKNFEIKFNDELIGKLNGTKELKLGAKFELDEDRSLAVKLTSGFAPYLDLKVNGISVPGSGSDPYFQLKQVRNLGLVIGGFGLIGVVGAEILKLSFFLNRGYDWTSGIMALLFMALAFLSSKKNSWAVWSMLVILSSDIALLFYNSIESGASPVTGIVFKGLMIFYLYRGIPAIKAIKKEEEIPLFESN